MKKKNVHFEKFSKVGNLYNIMSDINRAMYDEAKNGHIEIIIKKYKEKGGRNYDGAMHGASENGHIEIVAM